jgi:hypothetical protein
VRSERLKNVEPPQTSIMGTKEYIANKLRTKLPMRPPILSPFNVEREREKNMCEKNAHITVLFHLFYQ